MKKGKEKALRVLGAMPGRTLVYAYSLLLLIPFYFILATSLKGEAEVRTNPIGLPEILNWQNFIDAIDKAGLIRAFFNSVFVSVLGTVLRILFDIVIVFCLFKLLHRRSGKIVYILIVGSMFIPGTGWSTMIQLYRSLGLYDSLWGLVLGGMVGSLAFNMVILMGFVESIPRELNEAASIDGCNDMQYLFRVMVPVIKPAIVSVGVLSFTGLWNSLFTNLLLIRSESKYTLPQALLTFKSTWSTEYTLMFAGVLMGAIPLVALYLSCQKSFTAALTGSVKG